MLTGLYLFLNRCECGISRYGLCHYCGDNIFINIIVFVFVFIVLFKLFGRYG